MAKPTEAQLNNFMTHLWSVFLDAMPDGAKITPEASQKMTEFHRNVARKNWDLFVPAGSDGSKVPRPEDKRCTRLCAKYCRKAMRLLETNILTPEIYSDARTTTYRFVHAHTVGAPPGGVCTDPPAE